MAAALKSAEVVIVAGGWGGEWQGMHSGTGCGGGEGEGGRGDEAGLHGPTDCAHAGSGTNWGAVSETRACHNNARGRLTWAHATRTRTRASGGQEGQGGRVGGCEAVGGQTWPEDWERYVVGIEQPR